MRHLLSDLNNIINIENQLINSFQSDEKFQPYRARCEAERILLYTQVTQTESGTVKIVFFTTLMLKSNDLKVPPFGSRVMKMKIRLETKDDYLLFWAQY